MQTRPTERARDMRWLVMLCSPARTRPARGRSPKLVERRGPVQSAWHCPKDSSTSRKGRLSCSKTVPFFVRSPRTARCCQLAESVSPRLLVLLKRPSKSRGGRSRLGSTTNRAGGLPGEEGCAGVVRVMERVDVGHVAVACRAATKSVKWQRVTDPSGRESSSSSDRREGRTRTA